MQNCYDFKDMLSCSPECITNLLFLFDLLKSTSAVIDTRKSKLFCLCARVNFLN